MHFVNRKLKLAAANTQSQLNYENSSCRACVLVPRLLVFFIVLILRVVSSVPKTAKGATPHAKVERHHSELFGSMRLELYLT